MAKKQKTKLWSIKTASKAEIITTIALLIILGIILLFIGIAFLILIPFGLLCFYLAYVFSKELKRRKNNVAKKTETPQPVEQEQPKNTVKVTDVDGSEFEISIYQSIDSEDRVLIADGGRAYHTHLSCFKNWPEDAQRNFTGWKIVKKSEALDQGMSYCKFCDENDKVTLEDLLEESDYLLEDDEI